METVVLLKQVPATESIITLADDGVSIKKDDIKWVINPYDEFAVEEALRIKEAQGGTVTVVSIGSEKTVEALRTALAMGADKGLLINDPATENCDALGIAKILSAAIKEIPYDLIIAGQRAVDGDNYQVATAVAEYLGIPNISMVIEAVVQDGKIRCKRTFEGGTMVLESSLPALFTTQRGLNEPRYASLPGIMKAKKKPLDIKTLADIGFDSETISKPLTRLLQMKLPSERSGGRMIEGESSREIAVLLAKALQEEAKVI